MNRKSNYFFSKSYNAAQAYELFMTCEPTFEVVLLILKAMLVD